MPIKVGDVICQVSVKNYEVLCHELYNSSLIISKWFCSDFESKHWWSAEDSRLIMFEISSLL